MDQLEQPTRRGRRGGAWPHAALLCAFSLLVSEAAAEAPSDPDRPTRNLFGMTGAIDTPTAQMQPEGEIGITSGYFGGTLRNTLTAQVFSGVEASFRYAIIDDFFQGPEPDLYDRSFDLRLRLVREGVLMPELVLGFQDFLGTGVYSGEYFVATKHFFSRSLAVSAGVGWGRFAGDNGVNNPFAQIDDDFRDRDDADTGGGSVNFGQYFQGEEVGFFGSVIWETPLEGLRLKAEYADDDYAREELFSDLEQNMPVNFGVEYRVTDWLDLGAYYLYGAELGVRVSLSGNLYDPPAPADTVDPPLPFAPRPPGQRGQAAVALGEIETRINARGPQVTFLSTPVAEVTVETRLGSVRWATATLKPEAGYDCPAEAAAAIDAEFGSVDAVSFQHPDGPVVCTVALRPEGASAIRLTERRATEYPTDWHDDEATRQAVIDALRSAMEGQGLGLYAIELTPERASVYLENPTYRAMPRAIGRTARALARTMPPSVEHFEVIPVEESLPVVAVMLDRGDLEDRVNRPDAAFETWVAAETDDAAPIRRTAAAGVSETFPRVSWTIEPAVPVSLFDPDQPVRADLAAVARGRIEVMPGLSFSGEIQKRVVGNLDEIERESDSELPRVRSDIAKYLDDGDPALTRLTGDYVTKLDDAVYGRVSAGLIERMFAGVSGEVLWKPANQSWGVGAEVNYARQRDFDTLFTFQDYDVVTGHASLYWDLPIYDISAQLDAGRYLAGDYGGTITLKRRFDNGWEIGGFATFTDVRFDEFGEGSFDKGLFLKIPLNWAVPYETRSAFTTTIRPLTRDGGQRLDVANRLYGIVEGQDRKGLRRDWGTVWQ